MKDITANEYQNLALRTATGKCYDINNAGLGLAGEAGECSINRKELV